MEKLWRVGSSINNQRSIHIFITVVPKAVMVRDVSGLNSVWVHGGPGTVNEKMESEPYMGRVLV